MRRNNFVMVGAVLGACGLAVSAVGCAGEGPGEGLEPELVAGSSGEAEIDPEVDDGVPEDEPGDDADEAEGGEAEGGEAEGGETGGEPDDVDAYEPGEGDAGETDGGEGETGDDGAPAVVCTEDVYEDNDTLGFPAKWNGEPLEAISCGVDDDFFLLPGDVPASKLLLTQSWGPGIDVGNLEVEVYCGTEACLYADHGAGEKALDLTLCECPEGERVFVAVTVGSPANPPQGTRYALTLH